MSLLLSEADVRQVLDMGGALEAVESCFRHIAEGSAFLHPRQRFLLPGSVTLNHMAAADAATGYAGLKIYTTARGGVRFLVLLYRAIDGQLLALMEADYLGQMRTGAASGVATKYLARANAKTLGMIGTGLQARAQLEAIAAVRKLELVRVFGRNPERRANFAQEMSAKFGIPVEPAETAEAAVRGSDIVVTITTSPSPVVLGEWLSPGMHINAAGANSLKRTELDEAAVRRADIVTVDSVEQAYREAGELAQLFGTHRTRWLTVRGIEEVISGTVPGRRNPRQITLFKSQGVAIEDIAVAGPVYEAAVKKGLGKRIPLWEPCG